MTRQGRGLESTPSGGNANDERPTVGHRNPAIDTKPHKANSRGFGKRRVAGYARVSTDLEEQLTSYEAQVGLLHAPHPRKSPNGSSRDVCGRVCEYTGTFGMGKGQ